MHVFKIKLGRLSSVFLFVFFTNFLFSQEQPRLVVGVVVEQMRFDYLSRYRAEFSDEGFNRLMQEGAQFTYINHIQAPTYTAPGHASIYTGSVPFYHGLIGNVWYDNNERKEVYCVSDPNYQTVGAKNTSGQCSPSKLRTTTLGDLLKLSNNGASRVFSASLKDASAIIPGGLMADGAYWYDSQSGNFITSSFYSKFLPEWVIEFNAENHPIELMEDDWELKEKDAKYSFSFPDAGLGEVDVFKEGNTNFPHLLEKLPESEKKSKILHTPFGNTLLTEFVKELVDNEGLGKRGAIDLLTVSYSSTEYIGNSYGPNSVEIHDTYLRLDEEISELLDLLDKEVGKGKYLLFLTSDHGVKTNGAFLLDKKIDAGSLLPAVIEDTLRNYTRVTYGSDWLIDKVFDNHVYINMKELDKFQLNYKEFVSSISRKMRKSFPEISTIYSRNELDGFSAKRGMDNLIMNGAHPYLSGDLFYSLRSNYINKDHMTGTYHGSPYSYDTHVPLFLIGPGIPRMIDNSPGYIVDIVPTITNAIGILAPEGCIGIPLIKSYIRK